MNKIPLNSTKIIAVCILMVAIISHTACSQSNSHNKKVKSYSVEKIADLPAHIVESSGLIYFDSLLWTFNDGGHGEVLYGISINSGKIKKEIALPESKNVDWEDITQDASSIYVGDIGNNWGNRKDLCIYKISKSKLNHKKKKEIKIHKINYSYPDQTNFVYKYNDSPYDCEALVCVGDSLLLFTKNWKTHQSVVYSVPVYPGDYVAHKILDFDSNGLVTGADYNPETDELALCGHKNHIPFVIAVKLTDLLNSDNRNFDRFELRELSGVQIEGIAIYNNSIYLSSEKSTSSQALYRLKIN
jgi:hypothetical protein